LRRVWRRLESALNLPRRAAPLRALRVFDLAPRNDLEGDF
jgi:hypothetical protein